MDENERMRLWYTTFIESFKMLGRHTDLPGLNRCLYNADYVDKILVERFTNPELTTDKIAKRYVQDR